MKIIKVGALAAIAASALVISGQAGAAQIAGTQSTCEGDVAQKEGGTKYLRGTVLTSTVCEGAFAGNDDGGIANFGGFTDWTKIEKDENNGDETSGVLQMNGTVFGNSINGTWEIFNSPFTTLALVLKFDGGYTIHLLSGTSGTWSTDSVAPYDDNKGSFGLSHATLYGRVRTPPDTVPEPGSLALLGLGLVGLGLARRKR